MDIVYDSVAGRAKVVVKDGLNAGKTFLRLYGSNKEYMIREGDYPACRRSNLGERYTLFDGLGFDICLGVKILN